jgi:hypothetical protein
MPAPRNRRHIVVVKRPRIDEYAPHPRRIEPKETPAPVNRRRHAAALQTELRTAEQEAAARRGATGLNIHGAESGIYVQFESPPGVDLKLESLESDQQGIELVAFAEIQVQRDGQTLPVQLATVFIPEGRTKHFFTRFRQYATERTAKNQPRHKDMVDRIAILRLATLRALWTDATEEYPDENSNVWWEIWLRRHDGRELERLTEFAGLTQIELSPRRLQFDDRIVALARATPRQLSGSIDVLDDIAEVRKAKESAAFFISQRTPQQMNLATDLLGRTTAASEAAPVICILDTGVNRGHPLLDSSLPAESMFTYDPAWGTNDHHGHGTEMAGLALYGDLSQLVGSAYAVELSHKLESVKILPPTGANPPDLYGAITAEAAARVEIAAPERVRCFSLAVTAADERDRGKPTSWSAAIDALAAGRSFDPSTKGLVYLDANAEVRRLFLISSGNVSELELAHLDRSDTEAVHDPGQAWNAITVGAYTEKALITDPSFAGWSALAPTGDLSPWSTTSLTFAEPWPIKPEVVFEGGNVGRDGADNIDFPIPDLSLLSTHFRPAERAFALTWATSAAVAQVSRMAAMISADYPHLWPETIRALIVHSADWTRAMKTHLPRGQGKRARGTLLRRYGFGVPKIAQALRSANDSLTLLVQETIHPFTNGKMQEMHIHELPWPKDVLESLGEAPVRLRVTLSYFVEPNPSRRGWRRRHRYASYGLRFDVKSPILSLDAFRKLLNQRALEEDERKPSTPVDSSDWFFGEQVRNKGSIHSDIWVGTAADLAERGVIGIYPVSGWWKDLPRRDRSSVGARYALVASIETLTADLEVDIWTPVAEEVGIPIEISIEN